MTWPGLYLGIEYSGRKRRYGPPPACQWERCPDPSSAMGKKYCRKHRGYIAMGKEPNVVSQYTKTQEERFWEKVDKSGDCWIWTGAKMSVKTGYGSFRFSLDGAPGKPVSAHRVSYYFATGVFGENHGYVDHLCRNTSCVNPNHLEMVTPRENALRGIGPTAVNAQKTHCVNGHELSGENLINRSDGGRACRICRRKIAREWAQKRRQKRALYGS